ncbi:distal membrane-arm assembly complex protein 1 [Myxocyprinus asiaticus]|uniref:distal membrane-arm assembly complex protein 1 n=1 Tax=Myxocyprinus asiaticus TaxID=70543 RepID=UPI0022225CCE|nr:distal membrane-arm assembly complex protein 1 [Myxocyprinus asiaticus]
MSNPPPAPEQLSPVTSPATKQLFGDCWSCRLLSGGGLLASGVYVYMQARKTMRLGGPTSMGTVAQIVFAAGLAAWGIEVIADPVGKGTKKS